MKTSLLKPVLILTMLLMMFGLAGCNTMEGFGEDMKKLGDKIEKKASDSGGTSE